MKPKDGSLPETHPKNLAELEKKICETAEAAVQSYNTALYALKNYNLDVQKVVENSVEDLDPQIWTSLKAKREAKDKAVKEAESSAEQAVQYVNKLKLLVSKKDFEASSVTKDQIKHNIQKVQDDINQAKKELDQERKLTNITDKYWHQIQEARQHFASELETLFPNVKIEEKQLHVDETDFDLFVLHAYKSALFYQKELAKLETVIDTKLQQAVENARRGNAELLVDAQLLCAVEKERRQIQECYRLQVMYLILIL